VVRVCTIPFLTMHTLSLLLTRRGWLAWLLALLALAGGAQAAPVSFAKLSALTSSTNSASAPAATPAQTRESLDAVITLLDNDQQRAALVSQLKQLRAGMTAQQTAHRATGCAASTPPTAMPTCWPRPASACTCWATLPAPSASGRPSRAACWGWAG